MQYAVPRTSHQWRCLAAFCTALCVLCSAECAFGDDKSSSPDLMRRFQQEAPGRWEEYAQLANQLQGRLTFNVSSTNGDVKAQNILAFKANEKGKTLEISREMKAGGKSRTPIWRLEGRNPDYGFVLQKTAIDAPWVVSALIRDGLPATFEADMQEWTQATKLLVNLNKEPLTTVIRRPYFKAISCREINYEGENLVELVFDYPHPFDEQGSSAVEGGTLILDPQRFWCVRMFDVREKGPSWRTTSKLQVLELTTTGPNLPIPKRASQVTKVVWDGGRNDKIYEYDFELEIPRSPPSDKAFTLPAFGLAEPAGLPRKSVPLFVWLAIAGAVCLVLGAVCWKIRRNRVRAALA